MTEGCRCFQKCHADLDSYGTRFLVVYSSFCFDVGLGDRLRQSRDALLKDGAGFSTGVWEEEELTLGLDTRIHLYSTDRRIKIYTKPRHGSSASRRSPCWAKKKVWREIYAKAGPQWKNLFRRLVHFNVPSVHTPDMDLDSQIPTL